MHPPRGRGISLFKIYFYEIYTHNPIICRLDGNIAIRADTMISYRMPQVLLQQTDELLDDTDVRALDYCVDGIAG
jgi:hypothetical protein